MEMAGVAAVAMKDPTRLIVEEVHWTVAPGECWILAGSPGSGKSDFLMMVAGLVAPAAGRYTLFGEAMPSFDRSRVGTRLRVGLVFDGGQLLNHLTVAENVALPLRYHQNLSAADAADRVAAMLELTELTPWANSTPGAVGRNWQKRAGLARALMLQPEVLLLDNPLTGLDPRHTHWWLEFLEQLSSGHHALGGRPMTLLVTTENLRSWQGRKRQFTLLNDRRFTALGHWTDVERSTHPALREMMAAEPPA
jgi:ABC-type transporter Mla maintaining outer membrane lipid asymmetry ATPase subunit MlaF